ncbi:MAG: molybdopterin cofactor-binding domain-containing protein [Candidatus Korobacteraceae bacterium]
MSAITNVSRRGFLQGLLSTGAFVLSVQVIPESLFAQVSATKTTADNAALHPSLYLGIEPDGTVYIVAHRSEMGTGIRTSLPMVAADELDADWSRVKIEQAIGDDRYGDQNTDGSRSIVRFYQPLRDAGATARLMLRQAAAQQWKVPLSEVETELHTVVHRKSNRKADYRELVAAAAALPVPQKSQLQYKPASAWRYVGKKTKTFDLADVCNGKAIYGMDAKMDNMVYAAIQHPPVLGGKVVSVDDSEARRVAGVQRTVQIQPFKPPHVFQPLGGVAVIANNTWSAFQGRNKLKITWDNGPNASYNSEEYRKQLEATVSQPCKVERSAGDVDAIFAKGGKVIEALYYAPHLAHASMEPPVAVADFRDGKVTLIAPTQNPQAVQEAVSDVMGIPKENVVCHVTFLGGGFGRKSKPDYCAEAAVLSRELGRPVKVVWSREDDIKFDYYHSVSAMYMKAAVDARGKPTAWLQRSASPPIASTFTEGEQYGAGLEMSLGWVDMPFAVPNLRIENGPAKNHVRIGWLRSVANIYHAYAVQSFASELAHAAGRDPLDYLLELMGPARRLDLNGAKYGNYTQPLDAYPIDIGRLRRVTEVAAQRAGWGKRKSGNGWGMGIAVHRSFLTYVASVVEVEVDSQNRIRIPRVETVVDAGLVINPEQTRSQFEGANVFGMSLTMSGEITAKDGAIQQSNFNNYPVARMNQAPVRTNVHLMESNAAPGGVGEPGVPPFAPALCNAIFAATGKRLRELPLSKAGFTA